MNHDADEEADYGLAALVAAKIYERAAAEVIRGNLAPEPLRVELGRLARASCAAAEIWLKGCKP